MKTLFIILALAFVVSADMQMVIHKKDGTKHTERVSYLDSVTFVNMSVVDGLVSYFKFNGDVIDSVWGGELDKGKYQIVNYVADRKGKASSAISYNGTNQTTSIYYRQEYGFDISKDNFTFSFWIKSSDQSFTKYLFVANGGIDEPKPYVISGQGNNVKFSVNQGTTSCGVTSSKVNVFDGAWHHVCAVLDNNAPTGGVRLYIDGVADGSANNTITNTIISGNKIDMMYSTLNSEYTEGVIDEVKIFNRALTTAEIGVLFTE